MKKIIILIVCAMLCGTAFGKSEPFPGYNAKLDSGAKKAWKEWKKSSTEAADLIVEVIIKTNLPIKKKQKKAFKEIGFKYRSITGAIVTGSVPIKNLQCLTAMEFIDYIEAGKILSTKERGK